MLIEWCWEGYVTKYLFSKDHKTSWSAGAIKGRSSSVVRKPVSEWHHQGGSRGSRIAFFPFTMPPRRSTVHYEEVIVPLLPNDPREFGLGQAPRPAQRALLNESTTVKRAILHPIGILDARSSSELLVIVGGL